MTEWDRCKHWIEDALEYTNGTHSIEDIEDGVAAGRFQFWAGKAAAIVTEIVEYPRSKALNFFLVGGDLQELLEMEPGLCAWGKTLGCERVVLVLGRKGWEKVLKSRDYSPALSVMMKGI